jgi:hypothetical protein
MTVFDEIAESALAHVVGNQVARSYRRTTLFDKRQVLMKEWSAYCDGTHASIIDENKVVSIFRRKVDKQA